MTPSLYILQRYSLYQINFKNFSSWRIIYVLTFIWVQWLTLFGLVAQNHQDGKLRNHLIILTSCICGLLLHKMKLDDCFLATQFSCSKYYLLKSWFGMSLSLQKNRKILRCKFRQVQMIQGSEVFDRHVVNLHKLVRILLCDILVRLDRRLI